MIDDVIGPIELETNNIFNNQYGVIQSPNKTNSSPSGSPMKHVSTPPKGSPSPHYINSYDNNSNSQNNPLLLTSNAYLKYNNVNAKNRDVNLPPDVTSMDFIKSVVFLEKNIQQAQFAILQLEDQHIDLDLSQEEAMYRVYDDDDDDLEETKENGNNKNARKTSYSGNDLYMEETRKEQEALDGFNNVESNVQTNLSTNALLFMWYVLARSDTIAQEW